MGSSYPLLRSKTQQLTSVMSAAAPAAPPYGRELDTLLHHLKHLPTKLPEKHGQYHFDTWLELDPELVEDTGSRHGALNMMLERAFGTRKDGLVAFSERGTSLEAVAGVIRREITGLDGENVLLTKWTDDLTAAAKAICEKHGTKVRFRFSDSPLACSNVEKQQ